MANVGLYLLKLSFDPIEVGAGSMTLAMAVNAVNGKVQGIATGTLLEGTEHPQTFEVSVTGAIHATGLGTVVKVGAVEGEARVTVAPPAIGTYLAPFTASFALDSSFKGKGTFTVGSYTYESDVSKAA
jgi:hypothetical protein